MNVEIINKDEIKELFEHWSRFSKTCYNSEIDPNNPEAIGLHCLKSRHFSGSRTRYIEFEITDIPRFVVDQMVRHEVGTVKIDTVENVQSFRYVNKDNATVEIPMEIKDNPELVEKYNKVINATFELYDDISTYVTDKTGSKERGNEQARYVIPMATYSAVTIGFTIEAFIHFCNKRLCTRAEDLHRQCAIMMRDAVLEIEPRLKKYLVPDCKRLHWCPEEKSCGAMPSEGELVDMVNSLIDDGR